MDKNNLPLQVDPFRLAENAGRLQGFLQIKDMERLKTSLLEDTGVVEAEMVFGIDSQNIKNLKGNFEAKVVLQCQRCLEPLSYILKDSFTFGLIQSEEQAKRLPDTYEPLLIQDDELMISDMVEEELILNLPIVPMHDEESCKVKLPVFASNLESEDAVNTKVNPFKVIESLKTKNKE